MGCSDLYYWRGKTSHGVYVVDVGVCILYVVVDDDHDDDDDDDNDDDAVGSDA